MKNIITSVREKLANRKNTMVSASQTIETLALIVVGVLVVIALLAIVTGEGGILNGVGEKVSSEITSLFS